ncbi:phage integrase [Staphylococcus equorum subsp. equorum Mu2]|uniref:tyrosine-type recombinase/integrase n=1 Tax=Staphylococcus equorum TaxID=246432 RepID=UPI000267DEAA|nr:site-specific integrase [Staphylococcus equorum]CCI60791.1 phage integrase [Staphylococcus equorum subsp. equorum Mu2]
MDVSEYHTRKGELRYRFKQSYKDPMTNKWKSVSMSSKFNNANVRSAIQKELYTKIDNIKNNPINKNLEQLTLIEAIDEWFERFKKAGAKPSTIRTYENQINVIKQHIPNDLLITKITSRYLQKQIDNWYEEKGLSYSRVKGFYNRLSSTYKYVRKQYDMNDISAIERVILPKNHLSYEEIETKKNNYLSDEETTVLFNALDSLYEDNKDYAWARIYDTSRKALELQYLTGMRIGEILALQFTDTDFNKMTLDVKGTLVDMNDKDTGRYGYKDTTKTKTSYRTIDITTRCMEIIKSMKLKQNVVWLDPHYFDRNFIFTNTKGNPLSVNKVNEILKKAVAIAQIKKRVTTHTLRHTHISNLAFLDMPIKDIMERVGHSDTKTTLNIYTHVTDKSRQRMLDKLESAGY